VQRGVPQSALVHFRKSCAYVWGARNVFGFLQLTSMPFSEAHGTSRTHCDLHNVDLQGSAGCCPCILAAMACPACCGSCCVSHLSTHKSEFESIQAAATVQSFGTRGTPTPKAPRTRLTIAAAAAVPASTIRIFEDATMVVLVCILVSCDDRKETFQVFAFVKAKRGVLDSSRCSHISLSSPSTLCDHMRPRSGSGLPTHDMFAICLRCRETRKHIAMFRMSLPVSR
jgi:hypothetical protein